MKANNRILNQSTGGYKIDVYWNGLYVWTTDWYRTLAGAVSAAKKSEPKKAEAGKFTAKFKTI